MPRRTEALRIAIDTGGTFTDCVWLEGGRVRMLKVFSTPSDPSRAIAAALTRILRGHKTGGFLLLHGTTVGTNTLLQRRGARVAFVTTEGFEDTLEIGRQARPRLYDFFFDRIEPLVPASRTFGVAERTSPEGSILQRPGREELARLAAAVAKASPESVAVSLLFSFANPANERAVAAALKRVRVPVSLSHVILPEFREYERASTVAVNAYLQPAIARYLGSLERRLLRRKKPAARGIFVMQSSGGLTSLEAAAREPVRTLLSGPAGGVVGAAHMARRSGLARAIAFDMGGTSTDVALVDRALRTSSEAEVAGLPVRVPMLDIHTVGAGGGSLARLDAAGALRVGPESAGADPGPICYGKGTEPTVTDANLLLGRLPPGRFLGGEFALDLERAQKRVRAWLRRHRSSWSAERFAAGVVRVVNAHMEKAVRVVSVERGYDPRDFALVAFGGAGGMHACELALALGIPRVLVPALPGALSALGILGSEVVKHYSRSVLWRVTESIPQDELESEFRTLQQAAARAFRRERWQGSPRFERSVDVRYRGQGYELNVPLRRSLLPAFHAEHRRRYGYSHPGREVELVTLRLRAFLPAHSLAKAWTPDAKAAKPERARVFFNGKRVPTLIYDRANLLPGKRYRGPAVIAEYSATTVVPPGMPFHLDDAANLVIAVS